MILLGILLALLPGFAWLVFYLEESPKKEPRVLIATTFLTGGAFAFLALIVQVIFHRFNLIVDPINNIGASTGAVLIALFTLSLIEEAFKFVAAWLNVHKSPSFNRPVDAMIFTIVAALGFATIENIGAVAPQGNHIPLFSTIYETLMLRFVGATLLHSLTSGIMGYYWAVMIRDFGEKRYLLYGLLAATVLHAIFNYLIIIYGSLAYTLLFVLVIGLFVLHDFEKLKVRTI
jgi:protease PrsW